MPIGDVLRLQQEHEECQGAFFNFRLEAVRQKDHPAADSVANVVHSLIVWHAIRANGEAVSFSDYHSTTGGGAGVQMQGQFAVSPFDVVLGPAIIDPIAGVLEALVPGQVIYCLLTVKQHLGDTAAAATVLVVRHKGALHRQRVFKVPAARRRN